mmetsp:Transcript_11370/g.19723  ORF Transcript_11370/g.19723 Transcript_11370/m.19723 type:complete len:84 (+) Transcript_11370:1492-1743(+)
MRLVRTCSEFAIISIYVNIFSHHQLWDGIPLEETAQLFLRPFNVQPHCLFHLRQALEMLPRNMVLIRYHTGEVDFTQKLESGA